MKINSRLNKFTGLILKGMGMGAANVIPGVSGGTIALITGIFEPLIDSLKSINSKALKLFFTGRWKEFANHIQLEFLIAVFLGVGISLFSLARILKYLFESYPVLVWAFFFGLIIASVFIVGKSVSKWGISVYLSFAIGTTVALLITFFKPAQENDQIYYLFICGIVAVCSMILPGLSGSFILILLGNYQLVMLDAVSELNMAILLPVVIGAIAGLLAFSHLLSWIFKSYKDQTISVLTGFMLGSLLILWPWKEEIFSYDSHGQHILNRSGEFIREGYHFLLPDFSAGQTWFAIICIIFGFLSIIAIERIAKRKKSD
ncbi:MAG: DUF368 domain-containing protein [Bacteroidota bacterium]|nr:DUF368 domain-containing protein [Bacteroidota bacterium]